MSEPTTARLARVGSRFYHLDLYPDRVEYRASGARGAREAIPLQTITSTELVRGWWPLVWILRVTAGLQTVEYQPVTHQRGEAFRQAVQAAVATLERGGP